MSDGSFPSTPPPPPVSPIVTSGRAWWQNWWLITAAAVLLIVGAAALIAASTDGGDDGQANEPDRTVTTDAARPTDATDSTEATGATDETEATDEPSTTDPTAGDDGAPITPPPTADADGDVTETTADTATTDPDDDGPGATPGGTAEVLGAPAGARGDRGSPVPAGEIADLGEGWRLQVIGITEDATELVLGENQFNDPPREGTKFTFVHVALGYYGLDDPANAFIPNVSGLAAGSVELDDDCGVVPDEVRTFADVFTGGVLRGTLCFVTTPADDGTVRLYATTSFDGPEVFLDTTDATVATPMPTLAGPQPGAASTPGRLDPVAIGTPVDVGEGWTLTVTGPATDITDEVATENQFNDPPPDGFRFVGIDVEFRYDGEDSSQAFEVGTKMVATENVELAKGCGVIPDPADTLADVFAGGIVAGALCFVVPAGDVGDVVLYASTRFDDDPTFFDTGGPAASAG